MHRTPELSSVLPAFTAALVTPAAFRRSFRAGPPLAMVFTAGAALIGAGWGFFLALGGPFWWRKQWLVHRLALLV